MKNSNRTAVKALLSAATALAALGLTSGTAYADNGHPRPVPHVQVVQTPGKSLQWFPNPDDPRGFPCPDCPNGIPDPAAAVVGIG